MTVAADSVTSLVQSVDWLTIAPPTITATVALIVLVADLFVPEKRKPLLGALAIAGLVAALITLVPLRKGNRATFCLTTDADACSYTADRFTLVIQLLVLGGALLTALLSLHDTRKKLPAGRSGSCCSPRRPVRHCCPPRATWPPWSSPSRSHPCRPSRSSASGAATGSPVKRP